MSFKTLFQFESIVTVATLIRILPHVSALMSFKTVYNWKLCHTGCIDMVSPQCEFFDELQETVSSWKLYHLGCIDMVRPQYEFFDAIQDTVSSWKLCHIGSIDMVSPQCELFDEL